MNVGIVGQSSIAGFKKTENGLPDKPRASASGADLSFFSPSGVDLGNSTTSIETLRAQINQAPDVREEKLDEVRAKLGRGQYNDPAMIDRLADSLSKTIFVS